MTKPVGKLSWFAGGKDRGDAAISIIDDLLNSLNVDANRQPLQEVLIEFKNELEKR